MKDSQEHLEKHLEKHLENDLQESKIILFILLFLLALISVLTWTNSHFNQNTIKIAIAAPLVNLEQVESEFSRTLGQEMVDGARLYIEQFNKAGGINGKKLELLLYNDQYQDDIAEKKAREICQSPALGILGHATSSTSLAAGKVYQECEIPAITGNASADAIIDDNNWYFSTIFTNSAQGKFIIDYINFVLKAKNIYLIYSDDAYGETLSAEIKKDIAESNFSSLIGIQEIGNDLEESSDRVIRDLLTLKQSDREPDIVILATHVIEATTLVRQMRLSGLDYPIMGGDTVGVNEFAQSFADLLDRQNLFTKDVYAVVPEILNISDDIAQNFKNAFELRYGYTPGWDAASYYDAAKVLIRGIENVMATDENLSQKTLTRQDISSLRHQLRSALTQINSPATAIEGVTRNFYFNAKRNTEPPILIGIYHDNQLLSAFIQLTSIENIESIPDLEEQIQNEDIIQVDRDRYFQKTSVVYTGMDINEVSNIDEKTSSYLVDFYLWFRYEGEIQPDDIEFINYSVERLDSGERLALSEPLERDRDEGYNHLIYRIKADFYDKFDFHRYPFDRQTLSVRFRHNHLTRDRLIYAVDFIGMRDTNTKRVIENFKKHDVFRDITDWRVIDTVFFQDTYVNQSTLGSSHLLETDSKFEYSTFNVAIELERNIINFSIKNLLPLWFFVTVAYVLLFLPFENISIEAISGLLLAVVFYHLSLLDTLPDGIGYVVALDYAFYIVYVLLAMEIILVMLGYSSWIEGMNITHKHLIYFGRFSFPIFWFMSCICLYLIYS